MSIDDAVLAKIRGSGGELAVMRGERLEKNLASALKIEGVNNREIHESVRRLVREGKLIQLAIVDDKELPLGVIKEERVRQYIFRVVR